MILEKNRNYMSIEERIIRVGLSKTFKNICELYGLSEKAILDIGCGYGEYLRHFGANSVGITTTDDEVEYGKDNGLAIFFANAECLDRIKFDDKFGGIWANNLFEHLLSPHSFLMKLKSFSRNEAVLILGVPVVPKFVSMIRFKWFRGSLASNHINFFTHKTLGLTVERAGWKVREIRSFVFKNKFLDTLIQPFSSHFYVVAMNDSNFLYPPKKIKEWISDDYYHDLLSVTNQNK